MTNKKQLGMSNCLLRVIWLAQMLLLCATFRLLRVIKKENFADIELAVGTPAGFDPTKLCFKCSCWFGKQHKTDGTYYESCMYPMNWHFWCLFGFKKKGYLTIFAMGLLYPQQKHAYSALHPQAPTECSPLDLKKSSIELYLLSTVGYRLNVRL